MSEKEPAEKAVRDIRRKRRRRSSAEERIRTVFEGLRGEESIPSGVAAKRAECIQTWGFGPGFSRTGAARSAWGIARAVRLAMHERRQTGQAGVRSGFKLELGLDR